MPLRLLNALVLAASLAAPLASVRAQETYVSGDFGGSSTYAYDSLNRVVSKASAGFSDPITLSYAYDPLSRRISMKDSMGGTTSYAYDGEDRLLSLTTPWGGVITQTYDSAGRSLRLAYPNGLDADLSFESSTGRLASIITRAGTLAAPLASYAHTYDSRGDLATLTNLTGTKSFAYDPDERLTGVAQAATTPATQIESYTYDPEGNGAARAHLSIERMRTLRARTLEAVKDRLCRKDKFVAAAATRSVVLDSIRVARTSPGMRSMALSASR